MGNYRKNIRQDFTLHKMISKLHLLFHRTVCVRLPWLRLRERLSFVPWVRNLSEKY